MTKERNEKKMKNKKITLIDVLIVLIIIAAGFVVKSVLMPKGEQKNGKVEFVVLATAVDNKLADNLKPGDKGVISHESKATVEVVGVEKKPSELMIVDESERKYKKTESELTSDLYITVSGEADVTDEKIQIDDVFVRVGENIWVDSGNLPVHGTIVQVNSDSKE